MLKQYLRKAPTLIVIGVTGYAGWPVLFPEGDSGPPKSATKPPATAKGPTSVVAASTRNPFQVERAESARAAPPAGASPSPVAVAKRADLPELPSDEDNTLSGMRLGGTFIDGREQLAVIDNKVYARGEQLRGVDGSPLPYVVSEIWKDRAVIRRGRRNFVLGFSNVPRSAPTRLDVPGAPALARGSTTTAGAARTETAARGRNAPAPRRPGGDPGDPAAMILRLLSGLGGATGGGGAPASGTAGGLGATAGLNPSTFGVGIDSSTISAGLNALMGKLDDIGRGGGDAPAASLAGGTTP